MKPTLGILLVLGVTLAGCAAPTAPATAHEVLLSGVLGTVVDVELRPIEGASVLLEGSSGGQTSTDALGAFSFAGLPEGNATIRVEHPDYQTVSTSVPLVAGQTSRVEIRLVPVPRPTAHDETFPFQGHFDCASEVLILGADCLVLYENVTGENDPITDEANAFRLPVREGWETIYLNLTWESGAENQLEGMRLNLEHGNGSTTGHAYQVAQVDGTEQPLELMVVRGEPHPSADYYDGTEQPAMVGDDGEELQIRVFPRGKFTDEFGTVCQEPRKCLLGVGIGLDIRFDVHAIVHYSK
jgi:hypothetical protein